MTKQRLIYFWIGFAAVFALILYLGFMHEVQRG